MVKLFNANHIRLLGFLGGNFAFRSHRCSRLEEKVASQQAEIDQLKGVQPAAPGTTDAAAEAAAAAAKQAADAAADANARAAAAQADVNSLKPAADSANAAAMEAAKKVGELEEPAYIHYKGVKLIPGGYGQLATIYRAHDANSDTADAYGGYPFANSPSYHLSEFRATGRASRLSLKALGEADGMKFMGYTEIDFLASEAAPRRRPAASRHVSAWLSQGQLRFVVLFLLRTEKSEACQIRNSPISNGAGPLLLPYSYLGFFQAE